MTKRRNRRGSTPSPAGDGAPAPRRGPWRRRLLMAGVVAAAGLIVLLVSNRPRPGADVSLQGTVRVEGKPLAGARLSFAAEERSDVASTGAAKDGRSVITRHFYPAKADAEGRYKVRVKPGLTYTVTVRASDDPKAEPLRQPDGNLPVVEAGDAGRRFDIHLRGDAEPKK